MASRRQNGRLVFVALSEVKESLRVRVAERLIEQGAAPTGEQELELRLAAMRPQPTSPEGEPYGAWVTAEDAIRVRRGFYPRRVARG